MQGGCSEPFLISYANPVVTKLDHFSGNKTEQVTLNVTGASLGYWCSVCGGLRQCNGGSPTLSQCADLACASRDPPRIFIRSSNASVPDALCVPLCARLASPLSVVQCRTDSVIARGNLSVTVAGLVSAEVEFDYDVLLPVPTLVADSVVPVSIDTIGGLVSVNGSNLGEFGLVVVINDLGEQYVYPSLYTPSFVKVRP
jgi:hypothetical protein